MEPSDPENVSRERRMLSRAHISMLGRPLKEGASRPSDDGSGEGSGAELVESWSPATKRIVARSRLSLKFASLPRMSKLAVIVLGLLGGWASSSQVLAQVGKNGTLHPEINVLGRARDNCALEATRIEKGLKGTKPLGGIGAMTVPPGEYRVRVECEGSPRLVGVIDRVSVSAEKTSTPSLNLEPARIRLRAERNGSMVTAEVRLYRPKADEDEPALYTFPANQSAEIAAGRYDLIVSGKVDASVVIEAALEGTSIPKGKLTAFTADLSDGQLVVSAKENGKPAEAVIKVLPRNEKKRDLRVEAGQVVDLPPGRYVVETTLASAADFATKRQVVWVRSNKKTQATESFETGTLHVSAEGDKLEAVAKIGLPGAAEDFGHFRLPGQVVLTPGEYRVRIEANIDSPVKMQEARVTVHKGRHTKHSAKFHPTRLVVEVKRAGRSVEIQSIRVRSAGGGKDAGQPNFDGEYILWPGRYEIIAELANGDTLSDGPFEVQWGQRLLRTLEVTHGMLSVKAIRNGRVVTSARILVFKPGAAKSAAELKGEGSVALSPGTYDLKVIDGPHIKWHPNVRVHERKNTEMSVELEAETPAEGTPDLPVGDELPEGE